MEGIVHRGAMNPVGTARSGVVFAVHWGEQATAEP